MSIFKGAAVAIITPMTETQEVNYEKLGELIEEQIAGGTDAIVICGTTGEASTLSHEEHLDAIKYTVEKVNHRIPVIAGTGSNSTETAIYLSQEAEKDAVQSGYWQLYRYNPGLAEQGKNPFSLDSKEPDWSKFQDFLKGEVRFASLYKLFPESAEELLQKTEEFAKLRLETYKRLAGK